MIHLDHNAGAPLRPEVRELLSRTFDDEGGNPSSVHALGRKARARLDDARTRVAKVLGCTSREVAFTGSGSEAAAIAVLGAFRARADARRDTVVSTTIEHPCVLGALDRLEREGATVVRVAPDATGVVPLDRLLASLGPQVALCTVMWANNETGVLQPVAELSRACAQQRIVFHTDAVQAFGKVPASLREVPADLLSLCAHKLGGPAGVGVLYGRRGVPVEGLTPGHQENGRRGGTQSVALAQAMALSLELAVAEQPQAAPRVTALRDALEAKVLAAIPNVFINGAGAQRVGNTSNLRLEGADGEGLLIALDLAGICVSTGAACASGTSSPSHVLKAMGLSSAQVAASLRLSLGAATTAEQVDQVVAALIAEVPRARET